MPKNDDGEFELILGNRQLLSVFFIVVILLGVFFTMGYIVGRNSGPAAASMAQNTKPNAADSPAPPAASQPAADATATPPPPDAAAADAAKPSAVETHAAADAPKAEEPAKRESPAEREPVSATRAMPQSGETYLQVAAIGKSEADLFVDVLSKKGFHALDSPVPGSAALFRVLVGPVKDASAIAKARTDLQNAGFKGYDAIVRKY
ncbi:MAG: SPOR domain-containing protein [Bryobacteraceae bacterium]